MRRPGRPVSFVVALAYIRLTCRGTGLLRRASSERAKFGEEPAGLLSRQPAKRVIEHFSESGAQEGAVSAIVGQLLQEPKQPVDRDDLRLRHLSQASISRDESPRTVARQRESEGVGDRQGRISRQVVLTVHHLNWRQLDDAQPQRWPAIARIGLDLMSVQHIGYHQFEPRA